MREQGGLDGGCRGAAGKRFWQHGNQNCQIFRGFGGEAGKQGLISLGPRVRCAAGEGDFVLNPLNAPTRCIENIPNIGEACCRSLHGDGREITTDKITRALRLDRAELAPKSFLSQLIHKTGLDRFGCSFQSYESDRHGLNIPRPLSWEAGIEWLQRAIAARQRKGQQAGNDPGKFWNGRHVPRLSPGARSGRDT